MSQQIQDITEKPEAFGDGIYISSFNCNYSKYAAHRMSSHIGYQNSTTNSTSASSSTPISIPNKNRKTIKYPSNRNHPPCFLPPFHQPKDHQTYPYVQPNALPIKTIKHHTPPHPPLLSPTSSPNQQPNNTHHAHPRKSNDSLSLSPIIRCLSTTRARLALTRRLALRRTGTSSRRHHTHATRRQSRRVGRDIACQRLRRAGRRRNFRSS